MRFHLVARINKTIDTIQQSNGVNLLRRKRFLGRRISRTYLLASAGRRSAPCAPFLLHFIPFVDPCIVTHTGTITRERKIKQADNIKCICVAVNII